MSDTPLGPFRDEEEKRRVMKLYKWVSMKHPLRSVFEECLGDGCTNAANANALIEFLRTASSWNSAPAQLACWCLGTVDPESPIRMDAVRTVHNVMVIGGDEGDRFRRANARILHASFWTSVLCSVLMVMLIFVTQRQILSGIEITFLKLAQICLLACSSLVAMILVGILFLSVCYAFILGPISYARDHRLRVCAAYAHYRIGGPNHLKGLAECARSPRADLSRASVESLRSVLGRVADQEPAPVPVGTAESLSRLALKHGDELDAQIFKVISWCGEGTILPWLSRVAETAPDEVNRERARHALECVQERVRLAKDQAVLLRPAVQSEDNLLRPAASTSVPEEQLLRPLEGNL